MSNEILDEVYAAREKLWQLGGGTMRGVCEYLRECGRRAKARGVLWIESEEEREAIGAEVRARLAAEAAGEAVCVGEPEGEYRAGGKNLTQRHGEAEAQRGSATKGTKKAKGEEGEKNLTRRGGGAGMRGKRTNGRTVKRTNGQTVPRANGQTKKRISGRKGAPAQSEVMR